MAYSNPNEGVRTSTPSKRHLMRMSSFLVRHWNYCEKDTARKKQIHDLLGSLMPSPLASNGQLAEQEVSNQALIYANETARNLEVIPYYRALRICQAGNRDAGDHNPKSTM